MKLRRKPFLSILSLLLFTFLPLTIRAEEGGIANPQGSRVIRIDGTEIIPRSVEIKKGESLMWVNSSPVFAQVVFDTDLGQKVACAHSAGTSSISIRGERLCQRKQRTREHQSTIRTSTQNPSGTWEL